MKKFVLIAYLLSFTCASGYAITDKEIDEKKSLFGFSFGINQAFLIPSSSLGDNKTSNKLGFRMGVLTELMLSKRFSLIPKASLSFNNGKFTGKRRNNTEVVYYELPTTIDLAAHFLVKTTNAGWRPYFVGGPCYQVPINNKPKSSTDFVSRSNFGIDMGIGLEKTFTKFKIAPEIKFTLGLFDVSSYPNNIQMNYNNFTLVLNFKG